MDESETTRLRALLERAALPACEARLCEAEPLPWPAWYVMPTTATISRDGERIAEVMWDGPGLWSNDATATVAAARARLFAAIPTALPGLLDAAERDEREHIEAGESSRAAWRESERREQELRDRLIAAERERDDLAAVLETRTAEHALAMEQLAAVTAERDDALEECSTLRRGLDHTDDVIDLTRASLGAADDEGAVVAAERVTRELAVLRAQQAPLVACVDAMRAAATAAGWRDADATGETLVAWVRRGEREACARIARAHVGQQGMRAPAPRWMDVGERIAAAIEERGE